MTDITNLKMIPPREGEVPVQIFAGQRLKNPIYHCRPEHLWPKDIQQANPSWVKDISLYCANFAEPIRTIADELKCPACDKQVTGHHILLTDWRHKDAITYSPHGTMEGNCTGCGYPCRLKHEIRWSETGQMLVTLKNFPLFYHPSATERLSRG